MKSILIFFACYLVITAALNFLAIGYRKELVATIAEAKRSSNLSEQVKSSLDNFLLSMTSMRTSVILLLIFVHLLIMPTGKFLAGPEADPTEEKLWSSGTMSRIIELHMASAAAVNPLFGAFVYLAKIAVHFRFKMHLGDEADQRELSAVNLRYTHQ